MSFERDLVQPMFPRMRMNGREGTNWKIENGLWFWWTDATVMQTPFGEMRFPKPLPGGAAPGAGVVPKIPTVKDLTSPVAADKSEVELGARKSDQVVLRNSLPGTITLSLEAPETPGLEMKLDRTEVAANGAARILFTYDPAAAGAKGAQTVTLNVVVQPTNQIIPIQVTLKPPTAK
jgi:hypothetical protein